MPAKPSTPVSRWLGAIAPRSMLGLIAVALAAGAFSAFATASVARYLGLPPTVAWTSALFAALGSLVAVVLAARWPVGKDD